MEEKTQGQISGDLNPLPNEQSQENNLDIKTITDQGEKIISQQPFEAKNSENTDKNKEELENNLTTAREESVSDLNAELSKISSTEDTNILQKEKDVVEIIKEEDMSQSALKKETLENPKVLKAEEIPQTNLQEQISNISLTPEAPIETPISTKIQKNTKVKETNSQEKTHKKNSSMVRTYQNDLVNVIKTKKISMTQAVMMEKEHKDTNLLKKFSKIKKSTKKNIYLSILSIILVISGISVVFFVYYYKPIPVIKIDEIELKSFIDSEYQKEVFLEKSNVLKLTSLIKTELGKTNLPIGSLLHLYLTDKHLKENNIVGKKLLTTDDLFFLLEARVSETFLRFIDLEFMYGYYSSLDVYPFLILKTRSFDNIFPEILKWEKNLIEDLRPIFIEENPAIPSSELRTREFEFKDLVIKNKDTRAILNNSGEIIFIYSFVDKNTIVITTDKNVLQEISNRLILKTQKR
ncbi:MAG: hypothetical protein KAJ58_00450 [Candidatus Pacebacteria bacterium]|nr:hypothetical protein [Candidatus Paceibacterota bacterium]